MYLFWPGKDIALLTELVWLRCLGSAFWGLGGTAEQLGAFSEKLARWFIMLSKPKTGDWERDDFQSTESKKTAQERCHGWLDTQLAPSPWPTSDQSTRLISLLHSRCSLYAMQMSGATLGMQPSSLLSASF